MINMSLCLLNDHSKDVVFTYFLSIRWAKIRIDTKRKMVREEKHWEVENFNMTLSHKRWEANFQCRSEIQMKNLFIIVFCKIDNKKIEEKGNVQKTFTIMLFDFATFGCHIAWWASTTLGRSSCERSCSKFSKLKERYDNETNKKTKWKNLVSWKKKSNLKRNNRETNKTMAKELLEKNTQGNSWAHWHQRREKPLETLTCDF